MVSYFLIQSRLQSNLQQDLTGQAAQDMIFYCVPFGLLSEASRPSGTTLGLPPHSIVEAPPTNPPELVRCR